MIDLLVKGGWPAWLLLLCSIVLVALLLERLFKRMKGVSKE